MDLTTFTHREFTPDQALQILSTEGFDVGPTIRAKCTVLDTFDGRLHRAGLRLLARDGEATELTIESLDSVPATRAVNGIPRLLDDLPHGPFRARLEPVVEMRALLPLLSFEDRTTRAVLRDRVGKTVVSVAVHEAIRSHDATVPWTIDVLTLPGHEREAHETRGALIGHAFQGADSDAIDSLLFARNIDPAGFDSSATTSLSADMSAVEGFVAVLAHLNETIAANLPGTLDDIDTEFLHDLRVAIRRTRSVLGESKGVLPPSLHEHFVEEFKWLAHATSDVRDLDVYLLGWNEQARSIGPEGIEQLEPVRQHLQRQRATAFEELAGDLRSTRVKELLTSWTDALVNIGEPSADAPLAERPLGEVVAKRLRKVFKSVRADGRRIGDDSPAEELHELRKEAKKLRYLVECFASIMPKATRKDFVRDLKGLQDNLGEHQDAEVHARALDIVGDTLADDTEHPPPAATLIGLGKLTERQTHVKEAARREFAERFHAFDSKETRHLVRSLRQAMESE